MEVLGDFFQRMLFTETIVGEALDAHAGSVALVSLARNARREIEKQGREGGFRTSLAPQPMAQALYRTNEGPRFDRLFLFCSAGLYSDQSDC